MRVNELVKIGEKTVEETITHPAEYDEIGELVREAWEEVVEKQVPVMDTVYRDATPEEEAEFARQQEEMPAPEMTTEERVDQVESVSDMAYINSELALAMLEEMEV